ncbi:MAG: hypothetical protein WC782_02410 [Methylococcaceae bacterium]|jgi:hypothetical protein
MKISLKLTSLLVCLLMVISPAQSAQLSIPLLIDYSLIKKALLTQVYKTSGNSVEVWNSGKGCSFLKLSNPDISGKNGQIRLLNEVHARYGTQLGNQCLPVLEWVGVLESFQQPSLDASGAVVSFPITKANAYDRDGHYLQIGKLQELIKQVAEPKLAEMKLDLNEARGSIAQTLNQIVPESNSAQAKAMLDSLKFANINAGDKGVGFKLVFNAPEQITQVKPKPAPAFSAEEQKQWQSAWAHWDEFLTSAIQQASDDTDSVELREALMEILLDSRTSLQAGLQEHDVNGVDPVRSFFTKTWQRLAPVLKTIANDVPGMQGLRYLTFIAATDAIYELENIGAPFGLDISSDGLRRLARILVINKATQLQ